MKKLILLFAFIAIGFAGLARMAIWIGGNL